VSGIDLLIQHTHFNRAEEHLRNWIQSRWRSTQRTQLVVRRSSTILAHASVFRRQDTPGTSRSLSGLWCNLHYFPAVGYSWAAAYNGAILPARGEHYSSRGEL